MPSAFVKAYDSNSSNPNNSFEEFKNEERVMQKLNQSTSKSMINFGERHTQTLGDLQLRNRPSQGVPAISNHSNSYLDNSPEPRIPEIIDNDSDDLRVAERLNIQGRIIEVPDELLESSRQQMPEIIVESQHLRFDQNEQMDNNRTKTVVGKKEEHRIGEEDRKHEI